MERYEMGLARGEVDNFFWHDFCDYYLEIVKERLYNENNKYGDTRKSAQKTLYYVLQEILKMYSPFVPHITEYIYQDLFKDKEQDKILCTSTFRTLPMDMPSLSFGEAMKEVVGAVRKYKTEKGLSMKEPIGVLKIHTSLENIHLLRDCLLDIQACTRAMRIEVDVVEKGTNVEIIPVEMELLNDEDGKVLKKV